MSIAEICSCNLSSNVNTHLPSNKISCVRQGHTCTLIIRSCGKELSLEQSILSGCHSMHRMHCLPVVLSAGTVGWNFKVNCTSLSSAVAENPWSYTAIAQ